MWDDLTNLVNQQTIKDVDGEGSLSNSSTILLAELIRIDLNGRAESRQIRNIDLKKKVQQGSSLSLDELVQASERSAKHYAKNRMFGILPKTLVNLARAVKAGRPNTDKMIEVTLSAMASLDDTSLLKVGPDLANLCALALD